MATPTKWRVHIADERSPDVVITSEHWYQKDGVFFFVNNPPGFGGVQSTVAAVLMRGVRMVTKDADKAIAFDTAPFLY